MREEGNEVVDLEDINPDGVDINDETENGTEI
jgi:hypothetical protein